MAGMVQTAAAQGMMFPLMSGPLPITAKVSALLLATVLLPLTALSASPAGPAPIGYAQASGYFKKDSRPTLYQPLNMLDAREITSWCSTNSDPLADTLSFGFKDTAKIDEIRIYTGNGFDEQTFKDFSRARKIAIKVGNQTRTLVLEDHRGLQSFPMNPPLQTAQLGMEVQDVYPAEEDPDVPVCITDVVFYSGGKALNGAWLTQKLKFDRERAALLGSWYAGDEGSPNRTLSFFYDDTYRMVFAPYEKEGKVYGGSYDASRGHVTVEIPGRSPSTLKVQEAERGEEHGLLFEGIAPDDWKLKFRSKK